MPGFDIETGLLQGGVRCVAGVDEAGRGPLAGPVVAAAVILNPTRLPQGLDDSKKLTAVRREQLFVEIVDTGIVAFASVGPATIDRINIREAALLAMRRAVAALADPPSFALVDGRDVPPQLRCPAQALVGGDARSMSVAAASIVAKVMRDRMMRRMDESFPSYGFCRNMGYGTAEHRAALANNGPCPHHRRSFAPVREGSARAGNGNEAPRFTS